MVLQPDDPQDPASAPSPETTTPKFSTHEGRSFLRRLLLPAIIGLISFAAVLLLWQRLVSQERAKVQVVTSSEILFVKNKVESELAERILALEQLAGRWQVLGEPDDADWSSDTALAMSGRGFQAIEWVDPQLRVHLVAPLIENKAVLGTSFQADSRRRAVLQGVADQGVMLVSRSVDLKTGGRGFLVCVPIFSDHTYQGAIAGVFNYQDLLGPILKDVAQDDWLAVYENSEKIYDRGGDSAPSEDAPALEANIVIGQMTWQARLWPKLETVARARSPLPRVVLLGGLLMAGLLASSVYLAETSRVRAREVTAVDEQLKKEIAERERVEDELRHALRMEAVGRLAGGVAHSFNNLLLVIQGHAHVLLNSLGVSDGLQRHPKEILKASETAASLTRQLLAFSRKQILQPKVLDLNALISQTTELLPSLLGPDIELEVSLDPALGRVRADPGQVEQVIMNLVVNARDAMPEGGKLKIETANTQSYWSSVHPERAGQPGVMLAVSDDGCGMDEATRSRIFEPFFSTKEKGKGTGLGLSMVYGTVEQSGGSIKVLSAPGRGTTIQIWLPRAEQAEQSDREGQAGRADGAEQAAKLPEAKKPLEIKSPLGTETVLLAEDDQGVRRIAREFLKMKGYQVLEAGNAAEAIRIARECPGPIHLLLTDIVMPGLKGEELVERVINIRPEVKVLYMSAYTEDAVVNLGILAPGTNFIEKPFGPEDLARKVRKVLEAVAG
jgi:signal transduction histidine kinase/ActR/RegA family two-component response regulator